MSWKFGGIYLEKDYTSDLDALFKDLGYPNIDTHEEVTFGKSVESSFHGSAVGTINHNTLLQNNFIAYDCAFEPGKWFEMDETLRQLSLQIDILCFFLDGTSETYGFSFFSKGARIRSRGMCGGELVFEEGGLLPEEVPDSEHLAEEDRIFRLMEIFTGKSFGQLVLDEDFLLRRFQSTGR